MPTNLLFSILFGEPVNEQAAFPPKVFQSLKSRTKLKCLKIRDTKAEKQIEFFRASIFESSFIPETRPFEKWVEHCKISCRDETEKEETEMLECLRRSYLPHLKQEAKEEAKETKTLLRRKTSEESEKSIRGYRGAELLRLGSKTAELRHSSEEVKDCPNVSSRVASISKLSKMLHNECNRWPLKRSQRKFLDHSLRDYFMYCLCLTFMKSSSP